MPTDNYIHRLHARGERHYGRLRKGLEAKHKGQVIAIEVESGKYVIGGDELQVALRAVKKFPGKRFSFFRIGYPALHKLRFKTCSRVW
ncbi:MAG: hypothetical protein HY897_16980 [Deltaproteobacteria bacterium]|nr:hypothetical protein [Deltaproteobacteria bacterium]